MVSNLGISLLTVFCLILSILAVKEYGETKPQYQIRVVHSDGIESLMNVNAAVPLAEEDETTSTTTPAPGSAANATGQEQCDTARGCCYQYTWPGPLHDTGSFTYNCAAHFKNGSREPCKEPVVFTVGSAENLENNSRRPNLTALMEFCDENGCRIYCPKLSCIKYSFFVDGNGGQQLWNETKFCGRVTSANSDSRIENGCYKETIGSYTREVCVCGRNRCNSAPVLVSSALQLILFFVPLLFFR